MRKSTKYFEQMRLRPDRKDIQMKWIEHIIENPEHEYVQDDGRIRRWGRIPEAENRYIRVILLEGN
jgi:hypothetical protein